MQELWHGALFFPFDSHFALSRSLPGLSWYANDHRSAEKKIAEVEKW